MFARGYLNSRGRMTTNAICDPDVRERLIKGAIREVASRHEPNPLFDLPVDFFLDEIRWMNEHGFVSRQAYLSAKRSGRHGVPLNTKRRDLVFDVFEEYGATRAALGKAYDWDNLATAVRQELSRDTNPRRYRHVVIDEGQDLSPEMVKSLVQAVPPDGSVTFFGDAAQEIYGSRISWRSLGLTIANRWEFKQNYRNTRQIAQLALSVSEMEQFHGIVDLVEPVAPTADGPPPTLVRFCSRSDEIKLIVEQATNLSAHQSVAILLRNRADEELLRNDLPDYSVRLHRQMGGWEAGPGLKYGTYHSAKGLEFDTVIMPFLSNERLPDPDHIRVFGHENAMIHDGKLVYVGITRAKVRLILTYTNQLTPLLPDVGHLYRRVQR
jgi:superfamily I DNA/RNA helicase